MRLSLLNAAIVSDVLLVFLSISRAVAADAAKSEPPSPSPLWIQPSGEWYGIDGTWSNFAFFVGSPAQVVYLTVATALSEIWVVATGGCVPVQLCIDARGGVFDLTASETWRSLGSWQLGMNYTGMGGNGDYGLETVAFVNTVTRFTTAIEGVLVAAYNDTNYYQGYIGVGVTQGRFGSTLTNPFISQLVESYGTIPSHGYGYTAGAYYRENGGSRGTEASLTLGGYDKLRFTPHDTTFSLDPITRLPNVRLRGITAQVTSKDKAPTNNWTSTSYPLVTMDDSIIAIIDSSTPYLWLPTEVCERFAVALNLTWNDDLGVYVFSEGAQYTGYQKDTSLSFTFTLSSYQNADNFGQPFNTPGVVNITLPSAAFAQLLRYPFRNVIQWGESSIPYFPLKRSTLKENNGQCIIGRVFMQEAYIITSYDRGTFSLHQARFPDNASTNYSVEAITRPPGSPYPKFSGDPNPSNGDGGGGDLNAGQVAGIVLSIFIIGSIIGLAMWFCLRHRRKGEQKAPVTQADEHEDNAGQMEEEEEPQSPVKRMFTRIIRKKRPRKPAARKANRSSDRPIEVGADAQHQVFEMPVPPEPAELDSRDVADRELDFGVESAQGLSQYEITRRKLERQLQGPVPAYTQTVSVESASAQEKSMQDISPTAHYRPSDEPSPASSPTYANSNSVPGTLPSPMTPHGDWTHRMFDLPSPMTVANPTHLSPNYSNGPDPGSGQSPVSPRSIHSSQAFAPSPVTPSGSDPSPTSTRSMQLPSPTIQRTPIDPSRVICLGPLPENVQLPRPQPPLPPIVPRDASPPDGGSAGLPPPQTLRHYRSATQGSNDTLGSNFTVEEADRLRSAGLTVHPTVGEMIPPPQGGEEDDFPRSPRSMERIEAGSELVHVPQVAEKRYSWEDDQESR
ncbi:hypothetical protein VTK26DRAFT_5117 [Humicola hyalothermophila]